MALLITSCMFMYSVFATIDTATGDPSSLSMAPFETNACSLNITDAVTEDTMDNREPTTALSRRMKNFLNFLDFRAKGRWLKHEPSPEVIGNLDQTEPEFLSEIPNELSGERIAVDLPKSSFTGTNTQSNGPLGSAFPTLVTCQKKKDQGTTEHCMNILFKSIIKPFKKNELKKHFVRDTLNIKEGYYDFLEPPSVFVVPVAQDNDETSLERRHDLPRHRFKARPQTRFRHIPKRFQWKYPPAYEFWTNGGQSMSSPQIMKEADLLSLIKKWSNGSIKHKNMGKPKSLKRVSKHRFISSSKITVTKTKPRASTLSKAQKMHLAVLLAKIMNKYNGSTTTSNAASQTVRNPDVKTDEKVKSQAEIANFFLPENSWMNVGPTTANYIEQDGNDLEYAVTKYSTLHNNNLAVSSILKEIMKHVSIALDIMTTSKEFIKFFDNGIVHLSSTEQLNHEISNEVPAAEATTAFSIDKTFRTTCISTIYTDIDDSPTPLSPIGSSSTTNNDNTLTSCITNNASTTTNKNNAPSTVQEDALASSSSTEDKTLSTTNKENSQSDFKLTTTENWVEKMEKIIRTLPDPETDVECTGVPCEFSTQTSKATVEASQSTSTHGSNHIEGIQWEDLKKLILKIKQSQLNNAMASHTTITSTQSTAAKTESNKTSTKLVKIKVNASAKAKATTIVSAAGIESKTKRGMPRTSTSPSSTENVLDYGDYEIYDVTSPGGLRYDSLGYIGEIEDSQFMEATDRNIQPITIKDNITKSMNSKLQRTNKVLIHFGDTNDPVTNEPVQTLREPNRYRIHLKKPSFYESAWEVTSMKPPLDTELLQHRLPLTLYDLNTSFTLRPIEGNNILSCDLNENVRNQPFNQYNGLHNCMYTHPVNEADTNFGGVGATFLPVTNTALNVKDRELRVLARVLIKMLKDKEGLGKSHQLDSDLLPRESDLGRRMIPFLYQESAPLRLSMATDNNIGMPSVRSADHLDDKGIDQLSWLNRKMEWGRVGNAIASHLSSAYKPQSKTNTNEEFGYVVGKPLLLHDND